MRRCCNQVPSLGPANAGSLPGILPEGVEDYPGAPGYPRAGDHVVAGPAPARRPRSAGGRTSSTDPPVDKFRSREPPLPNGPVPGTPQGMTQKQGANPMPPRNLPQSPAGIENSGDPATAAILAGGCADGVPTACPPSPCATGAPMGSPGEPGEAGVHHLAVGHRPVLPDGEIRPLLPQGKGLVRRHRGGPPQHAVPAGPSPVGGDASQPGATAPAEAQRAGVSGPGPPAWCATGASSAWPAGAASPSSGTWSAIPPPWPGWRRTPIVANRRRGRRPWRKYPRSCRIPPTPASGHPGPEGGAFGPPRIPGRRNPPCNPALPQRPTGRSTTRPSWN